MSDKIDREQIVASAEVARASRCFREAQEHEAAAVQSMAAVSRLHEEAKQCLEVAKSLHHGGKDWIQHFIKEHYKKLDPTEIDVRVNELLRFSERNWK